MVAHLQRSLVLEALEDLEGAVVAWRAVQTLRLTSVSEELMEGYRRRFRDEYLHARQRLLDLLEERAP
jgi:hypothetical protein